MARKSKTYRKGKRPFCPDCKIPMAKRMQTGIGEPRFICPKCKKLG